jgi:hypothetical protein
MHEPVKAVPRQYGLDTASNGAHNGRDTATGRFTTGNAGRPKGAKNKATCLVEAVQNGDASDILVAAVRSAVRGSVPAQKSCLDHLVPLRRERPVALAIPVLATPSAAAEAVTVLVEQVAAGQVTPSEGKKLLDLIVTQRRLGDAGALERRIERLESVIDLLRTDLATILAREDLVTTPLP